MNSDGTLEEKEYPTPVTGVIHRFSSSGELYGTKNIWLEFKWTKEKSRFEIEFEVGVPEEFSERENVEGWRILE